MKSPYLRYLVAIVAVAAAALLRVVLNELFQQQIIFLLFFASVMVASWYGGLGPGLLSTVLSIVSVTSTIRGLPEVVPPAPTNYPLLIVIFAVEGVLISGLCEAMRRARYHALSESVERREAQAAQRELEQRFRATFEQAAVGIAEVGLDGNWQRVNQRLCAIVGYTEDELLRLSFQDITYPADLHTDLTLMQQLLAGQISTYTLEKRYICKDRSLIWINLTASLVRTPQGAPKYFVAVIEDINDRKRAELALQESEARFRTMADSAPVMLWLSDADGRRSFFNQPWLRFTGHTLEHERGLGWADGIHPDDRERWLAGYFAAISERRHFGMEYRLRRHDGQYRWMLVHGAPRLLPDGTLIGYIGSCVDFTERRELEQRQHFLAEASAALSSSLDYTSTLDSVARLIVPELADACLMFLGNAEEGVQPALYLHANPAQQAKLDDLFQRYPANDGRLTSPIAQAIGRGQTLYWNNITPELLDQLADDYQRQVIQAIQPVAMIHAPLVVGGRSVGVLAIATSDSRRRYTGDEVLLTEELAQRVAVAVENARLYREAQEAIRLRETFLSIAAHELKTPLTALLGYAHVLERRAQRQPQTDERNRRTLHGIAEQGARLNRLIETLLDLTRIQSGRLSIDARPMDLAVLARAVIGELQPTLDRHTIELRGPATLPIVGDTLRLEQVIQNLLSNAVKYSPAGGVVLVRLDQQDSQVVLSVTDQGIGIPQAAQSSLFEQFFRATNVDPRQISGLGIGLFVVHEIVMRHGGTVDVESQEHAGSTFTVRLPSSGPMGDASHPQDATIAQTAAVS